MENTEKVSFWKRHKVLIVVLSSVLALLLAGTAVLALMLPSSDTVADGVVLFGQDIGGMTVSEVEKRIYGGYFDGKSFVITGGDGDETVKAEDIGLKIDKKRTAEKAYSIARGGNFFVNIIDAVKLKTGKVEIYPCVTVDIAKLDSILLARGIRINGEGRDIEIEDISETEVKVKPYKPGQKQDVSSERGQFITAVENGNYNAIQINFETYESKEITADELYNMLSGELKEAKYVMTDGVVGIEKESAKREVDKTEIESKLADLNGGKEITLKSTSILPENTYEKLESKLFTAELASYKSTYSTGAKNRAFNVNRAASSVDGTILMPGEVFSYNDTIGNPSLANGYKVAPVYSNGKESTGVGGGVCQVSSTLYSAVLYANLEIVERRNHSLTVGYVPKGQDATVSYGSVDFKFKNNTPYPIKINASATGGVCLVSIVGGAPDIPTAVKVVNSINQTISPDVVETPDETKPVGFREVTEKGKTGYKVSSTRIVYENGVEVKRESLTSSYYRMIPSEVTVGAKIEPTETPVVAPTEPVPEVSPSPEPSEAPAPTPSVVPETPHIGPNDAMEE